MGPYEIVKSLEEVAYDLKLPIELSSVHTVFHVSMLKKYIGNQVSIIPLEILAVNENRFD